VRRAFLALAAIAVVSVIGGIAYGRTDHDDHVARPVKVGAARPRRPHHATRTRPLVLAERRLQALAAPVQDPATAAVGSRVVLAGGLTAADSSTDAVVAASPRERLLSRLPGAQHDAAAVALGGQIYVFGGGNGAAQLDHVLRVDPVSGAVHDAGRLPVAASDVAAAALGGTAYVVGGYTGTAG
jgi:hypothetical protein